MRVLQVGLGSGGAPVCEHLTMNGVRRWELFDPDKLDDLNLVKHPGRRADLGRLKVEIQREWILDRNPRAEVIPQPYDVFSADYFREGVKKSSLVLCCADKKDVRLFVNAVAREEAKPCITASVFRQGFGGEVYVYMPGETACFACMDRASEEQGININDNIEPTPEEERMIYGLNIRDFKASGLSLDIQAISLLQARVALSMLTIGSSRQVAAPSENWLVYYNRPIPGIQKSGFSRIVRLRVKARKDCPCARNGKPIATQ